MELQQTIQATCRVSVILSENGELSAKIFASAPYNEAGGTTTAELPVSTKHRDALTQLLTQVLDESRSQLGAVLGAAIHTSREAATRLGE